MNIVKRRGDAPPMVWLVIIGVVLILVGVVATPVFFSLGNAAFWIGVFLLAVGILLAIFA
jgi:uncharacterized membrane protein HdeD (DUF308 family)